MQSEELKKNAVTDANLEHESDLDQEITNPRLVSATQIVTADFVQAEEVPTIPIASLQTISNLQPEVSVYPVASTQTVTIPAPLVVQPVEYQRSLREWVQIWCNGMRLNY